MIFIIKIFKNPEIKTDVKKQLLKLAAAAGDKVVSMSTLNSRIVFDTESTAVAKEIFSRADNAVGYLLVENSCKESIMYVSFNGHKLFTDNLTSKYHQMLIHVYIALLEADEKDPYGNREIVYAPDNHPIFLDGKFRQAAFADTDSGVYMFGPMIPNDCGLSNSQRFVAVDVDSKGQYCVTASVIDSGSSVPMKTVAEIKDFMKSALAIMKTSLEDKEKKSDACKDCNCGRGKKSDACKDCKYGRGKKEDEQRKTIAAEAAKLTPVVFLSKKDKSSVSVIEKTLKGHLSVNDKADSVMVYDLSCEAALVDLYALTQKVADFIYTDKEVCFCCNGGIMMVSPSIGNTKNKSDQYAGFYMHDTIKKMKGEETAVTPQSNKSEEEIIAFLSKIIRG